MLDASLLCITAHLAVRCIPEEGRSAAALKTDLSEWMRLVAKPIVLDESTNKPTKGLFPKPKMEANFQNKRLAMMALYTRKALSASDVSDTYKLALR